MNPTSLHNSATRGRGRRLAFASAVSALALVGAVGLGFTYSGAQAQQKADSVQTPFGRAPLSFADIVDRVKPAVVSIQVSNGGAKVAANPKSGPAPRGRGQEGIPEVIPVEMCYLGWQESLAQLAKLVEPEIPG